MKYRYFLMLCLILIICSCDPNPSAGTEPGEVNYYSKEVELSAYVDPDGWFLEPVESRIYGEDGKLSAVFEYLYEDQESSGYYANTRTNVYEADDAGELTLVEYYEYDYIRDDYEYVDEDDVTQTDYDYILTRGETRSPDDELIFFYDVTYLVQAADYDLYTSIIDYDAKGTEDIADDTEVARQEVTYLKESGNVLGYRTEKFYCLDDDDNMVLSKEFACWYDSADPYDYLYELYHSFRSDTTDTSEEFYYFTRYSRDANGYVYEQADFDYDSTGVPGAGAGDYSYTTIAAYDAINYTPADVQPFVYDILFDNIGEKATVLTTEYDAYGNIIKDERSLNGSLSEYTVYSYNSDSELTEQARYTKGGTLLYDRTSIRYSDEIRDDEYFRKKETYTYKFYDYAEESQSSRSLTVKRPSSDREPEIQQNNRKEYLK